MRLERSRQRELSKAVADHVFSDIHTDKILAVVNEEGVTDEVGRDHRTAGPCLDRALLAGVIELVDFVEKRLLDKGSFFERTSHGN